MKPLLCLVMIVCNEADVIRKTLQSAKPFVDRWCIAYNGDGNDETMSIIDSEMSEIPGHLHRGIWNDDFSEARNQCLDWAEQEDCEFTLFLDANDELVGGQDLRYLLEGIIPFRDVHTQAFLISVSWKENGVIVSHVPYVRILRTSFRIRYEYPVHEVPQTTTNDLALIPPSIRIENERTLENAKTRARFVKDVKVLKRYLAQHPKDTRATFYLAQTYSCLRKYEKALKWYVERSKMGGWKTEAWTAAYRAANVARSTDRSWAEIEAMYLHAWDKDPTRIEPLLVLVRHYKHDRTAGPRYHRAWLYLQPCLSAPIPKNVLKLVQSEWMYERFELAADICHHVNQIDVGRIACDRALMWDGIDSVKPGMTTLDGSTVSHREYILDLKRRYYAVK